MSTATSTCYRQLDGLIQTQTGWVICPNHYQGLCCLPGSECLDEQICYNPKDSGPGFSGYYIGLCTDATYNSSSCSSRCTDDEQGDVTYNSNTSLWACCGTAKTCADPTNETFLAPPPQQLLAAASLQSAPTVSSRSAPAAASTSISRATVTVKSTPSTKVAQTSSLNEGAKAGIGVGAALAALAILALLGWAISLRKRLRSHGQARYWAGRKDGGIIDDSTKEELPKEAWQDAVRELELSGYSQPHEMQGML